MMNRRRTSKETVRMFLVNDILESSNEAVRAELSVMAIVRLKVPSPDSASVLEISRNITSVVQSRVLIIII